MNVTTNVGFDTVERGERRISAEQLSAAEEQIVLQSKRIEYYLADYSLEFLAEKMKKGGFAPSTFQSKFDWDSVRRSTFIESLLIGLPVPPLFFWKNSEKNILEVVDGWSRIMTIHEFVNCGWCLGTLRVLTRLEGFQFSDLSETRRRKFLGRLIRGMLLNQEADEESRNEISHRINCWKKGYI